MNLSDEERARRREQLIENKANPQFEHTRIKRVKAAAKVPAAKVKRATVARSVNDKRRGFKVPAKLWKEYRFLKDTKLLTAAEAGRILGLVKRVDCGG